MWLIVLKLGFAETLHLYCVIHGLCGLATLCRSIAVVTPGWVSQVTLRYIIRTTRININRININLNDYYNPVIDYYNPVIDYYNPVID